VIDGGVLGDAGRERARPHRRARRQDDQVAGLEAAGHVVEVVEPRRGAGHGALVARQRLEVVELLVQHVLDRAHLGEVTVVAGTKERLLCLLN
jgi:hypothetical protein